MRWGVGGGNNGGLGLGHVLHVCAPAYTFLCAPPACLACGAPTQVDSVLYMEGDDSSSFRLLRVHKNRHGPSDEVRGGGGKLVGCAGSATQGALHAGPMLGLHAVPTHDWLAAGRHVVPRLVIGSGIRVWLPWPCRLQPCPPPRAFLLPPGACRRRQVGVFKMGHGGLAATSNHNALFLESRSSGGSAGGARGAASSVVGVTLQV